MLAFSANGSDSVVSSLTVFIETFFVVLIMAASLILIYNVFQMSYRERTKYLGMLSSVGATGRQKRCSVYYEAGCLLLHFGHHPRAASRRTARKGILL